jgi:GT2 family glycosyltransferase
MLGVCILHYGEHQVDMTMQCVDRLKQSTKGEFDILVWVNGEINEPYNLPLVDHHDRVAGTQERYGLAAAYNKAMYHMRGDMFAILHNDCFVTDGWNVALEAEAANGNIAFPIVKTNEAIASARGVPPAPAWMPPSCCFVIGKDELETLHGWDGNFDFCHFEDMDLFKRATDAGMRLVRCDSEVLHLRGVTRADQADLANEAFKINERKYIRKHGYQGQAHYALPVLELPKEKHVDL